MAIYKAQVAIPRTSGLPEDIVVNTFHFRRGTTAEGSFLDTVQERLAGFYREIRNAGVFSDQLLLGNSRLKVYDIADAEPRVPVVDDYLDSTLLTSTEDPLPSECAIVVSWQGEPLSGIPAGRRRGRTYVGPISRAVQAVPDRDRIDVTHQTDIRNAADNLITAFTLDSEEGLVIYSHTGAIASKVVGGFVDNAFDTQRRRGKKPTNRLSFVL